MNTAMPTGALGLIAAAAISTLLLTAAAPAPTSETAAPETAAATVASSPDSAQPGATPGQELSRARASLHALVAEISERVEADAEHSEQVTATRGALDARLVDAARVAPSAEFFSTAPAAHLFDVEDELVATIETETAALRDSFDAWLIAVDAARSAREQAAEQARFEAQQSTASSTAPSLLGSATGIESYSVPSSTAGAYSITPVGSGGQGLIDACTGPVWWTPTIYPYLAEHWHCGGSAFPRYAGALVGVSGSGLYQSVGVVAQVNAYVEDMLAVPAGYDLYYQTCLNNDPSTTVVIGLMLVG